MKVNRVQVSNDAVVLKCMLSAYSFQSLLANSYTPLRDVIKSSGLKSTEVVDSLRRLTKYSLVTRERHPAGYRLTIRGNAQATSNDVEWCLRDLYSFPTFGAWMEAAIADEIAEQGEPRGE